MREMYRDFRLNALIIVGSLVILGGFWLLIRNQVAIDNKQFLRSMIPHHAGAVLMCNEAEINDNEIKELCDQIVQNQKEEIDQMKDILKRME